MNCEQACELIALAASGDVTPAEQSAIAAHMAECAACRDEAAAFAALAGELASMREECVPDYAFASVRANVIAQIDARKRPVWLGAWPAFAAVVACSVMLVVLLRPEATIPEPPVQPEVPAITAAPLAVVEVPAVAPVRRVYKKAAPPRVQETPEPLVVKMLTDDPEVVIYWMADAKREGSEKEMIR